MSFFKKIWEALKKTRESIGYKLSQLFGGKVLDDDFYDELEAILLSSDMGAEATLDILDRLKDETDSRKIKDRDGVLRALKAIMIEILEETPIPQITTPAVITVVGVNGVGKTTAVGKLAKYFSAQKLNVLIAAADTFRAAASEQLSVWAQRAKVKIVRQDQGADAASVVYDAIQSAKAKDMDILLIDTAGRLHNKKNLMEELKKIVRISEREFDQANHLRFLVLDATTGQNAISQADIFNEAVSLDGIILTKLDGTAKGGVALAIAKRLALPVMFVGVGEGIDDLIEFDAKEFVESMF
ncbi:MAG TPA: signal recognition particle-docking protein FtsY [Clostridiales bacterium]|jgi:fused signal recognition particle receptor|nr:signal recognition particle-docking protein FtsY [Clostridiales bacterium]